ncbi:transcription elongation factor TFIIS-like [Carica papaya]|uniref:transcription elongation factor TFIIS-like n=1 Tax=Carica papaya TaxID=3649 RepID=UPI000B8CFBD3|nr:transcription elongation factor TFIIS-like [Carica papaya]
MDETLEILAAAKKAADSANIKGILRGSSDISRCVDCLKKLETCPFNAEIINTHNIYKKLQNLCKHKSRKICSAASRLIDVWKKREIEVSKRLTRPGIIRIKLCPAPPAQPSSHNVSNSPPLQPSSLKMEESTKASNKGLIIRLKMPLQTPVQPSSKKVEDAPRKKVRAMLEEAFSKVASESRGKIGKNMCLRDPVEVAATVESEMFAQMGSCLGNQKTKYRSILFNLRDAKNPDLRRKVLCGDIKPAELIKMKSEEMASNQLKLEMSEIRNRAALREESLICQLAECNAVY